MSTTLTAYRVAPQMEHRAAREIREAGLGAILPLDRSGKRAKVTAPSYVFADGPFRRAFAKHVKRELGPTPLDDVMRLFVFPPERKAEQDCPYTVGQQVMVGEVPATIVEIRGRIARVTFVMAGKTHTQSIAYAKLKPG